MALKHCCLCALLAASIGCASLAPRYTRPPLPVPDAWGSGQTSGEVKGAPTLEVAADVPWSEFFLDERLRKLIGLALKNNRDLRIALLNIERSRAQFQIQRTALYPEVDAAAGALLQRLPPDFSGTGKAETLHQYSVGLGVSSYELDLFGRVRSLKDQALEQYLATEHARRSVQVSLVSQVALAYLALAADREHRELAREILAQQQETLRLVRARFEAGVSSALDVNQAQTTVDAARVDLARFSALAAEDGNALNLALGAAAPAELLPQALPEDVATEKALAPGLPSAVLLRRPDILEAEGRLKGANANIGAARAALFPRIALTTSAGLGSGDLAGLFDGSSAAWSFAPQISLPIFDAGSRRAKVKVAVVDRDLAIAQYEKAIQTAFREVADALAERGTIGDQLAAQQSLAEAAGASLRLSQARYEKGVDSYLVVLDSQRALSAARQNLIATRLARLANLTTLYKVLGGGAGE